tara:strand:- start:340 stop:612 length:273 start_codon:yes stop_codon:yes gene_type:complete
MCNEVINAPARYKGLRVDKEQVFGEFKGSSATARVIGYVEGYITGKNKWKDGKIDWFKGVNANYLINWSASYCRSNPSDSLHDALGSFSK